MNTLRLKKNEDRRIKIGHLWIFSNEVDTAHTPLTGFEPGEPVRVENAAGNFVATALVNPASLICARVMGTKPSRTPGYKLIRRRLEAALALRERLFAEPFYRLCFAEADYLPGLVVDRYDDLLVAQLTTAGMERFKQEVVRALDSLLSPRAILLRNDAQSRTLEGLDTYVETALGEFPDEMELTENGLRFLVSATRGQKTGWFYDMRLARERFASYCAGRSVLDVFSYAGGAGLTALAAGAERAVLIDASAEALAYARRSAERNTIAGRLDTLHGDVFEQFDALKDKGERFDCISLDPPAFVKSKKDKQRGEKAYVKANREAMKLLGDDAVLMTCSCSQHMSADDLRQVVVKAANQRRARVQILEQLHQGPDHPVHPAMVETNYLKAFIVRVRR